MDRPQCPYCQSFNVTVYCTRCPIRYVRCRECKGTFKMGVIYQITNPGIVPTVPRGTGDILPSDN